MVQNKGKFYNKFIVFQVLLISSLKEDYRKSQMERESMSTPVSLLTSEVSDMLKPVYRAITKFALIKIKNQLVKGLKEKQEGMLSPVCSCFVKVWKLPCRHELVKCVEEHGQVKLDLVHPRWHIYFMNEDGTITMINDHIRNCYYRLTLLLVQKVGRPEAKTIAEGSVSTKYQDVVQKEFSIEYEHLRNQLDEVFLSSKTYQEKQDILDSMEELIERLAPNDISNVKAPTLASVHKGRPKLSKRNKIGIEVTKEKLKEADKERGKKRKIDEKVEKAEKAEKNKKQKMSDNEKIRGMLLTHTLASTNPYLKLVSSVKVEKKEVEESQSDYEVLKVEEKEYLSLIEQIHPSIEKNWYTAAINVRGDGFCGFRALAVQLYGDEEKFWEVKMMMRDFLLTMDEGKDESTGFYKKHLKGFIDYQELKSVVCFGLQAKVGCKKVDKSLMNASQDYWFTLPGCAQLAADTFQRLVATYAERKYMNTPPCTFVPLTIKQETKRKKEMPLLMQRVNDNHFITLSMKRAIKPTWSLPQASMYESACESLGISPNFKRTFWNHYLFFQSREKKPGKITLNNYESLLLIFMADNNNSEILFLD